jgi:hypothetical protein
MGVLFLTTLNKRGIDSTYVYNVFSHSLIFTHLYSQFIILRQSTIIQQTVWNRKKTHIFSSSDRRYNLVPIIANYAVISLQ